MSGKRWLQKSAAVILMGAQLSGCTSWHAESLSPVEVVTSRQPSVIRAQQSDGGYQILDWPEVRGDSLIGRWWDVAVPIADVTQVSTRKVSWARTTPLLIGAGALIAAFIAVSASMQGMFDGWGQ
jgi:hypothetical protein